ncbi:MAG: hypothetical protein NC123_10000 [Butyrivibrio sp.]|nr:hypothetical protein [Acetatifactor muris]MCM1559866.1 hypothetical protein [Butyrivibrio sp.]
MNKRKKLLAALGSAACVALAVLTCPVSAISVQAAAAPQEEAVMPMSDDIRWKYIVFNHRLYRRLFNYSTNTWAGKLEYVMEWPYE